MLGAVAGLSAIGVCKDQPLQLKRPNLLFVSRAAERRDVRSHAERGNEKCLVATLLRGNGRSDALRPDRLAPRSGGTCVPTPSVGTRMLIALQSLAQLRPAPRRQNKT
jgi:hypothetical protein